MHPAIVDKNISLLVVYTESSFQRLSAHSAEHLIAYNRFTNLMVLPQVFPSSNSDLKKKQGNSRSKFIRVDPRVEKTDGIHSDCNIVSSEQPRNARRVGSATRARRGQSAASAPSPEVVTVINFALTVSCFCRCCCFDFQVSVRRRKNLWNYYQVSKPIFGYEVFGERHELKELH